MRLLGGLVFTGALLIAGGASAQWATDVKDDLFSDGKTATMIGSAGPNYGIYVSCSSEEADVSFAYIEKSSWESGLEAVPAKLAIQVDGGQKHFLNGYFYQHNNDFIGVKSDQSELIRGILRDIRDAQRQIVVGVRVELFDTTATVDFSVAGSTKATSKLFDSCNLSPEGPES
ncbi:hypothetical protein [Amorphus orientalis]|uniref:Uncharacterized protein n=1 Tax=Amorphus orientalis TaxID=649198 RepID=A0AAE4AVL4_9HYPH|nr:hypothetical protein [Amorphus orientalis]MDQ0316814.1 hypothetical protein [Amorphus orientalis]